jgi:transcriptional regulator of acetoin/glycerol metabolism
VKESRNVGYVKLEGRALERRDGAMREDLLYRLEYHWPGNVRELKNAIERAYILCEQQLELQPMHIRAAGAEPSSIPNGCAGISVPIGSSLAQTERWLIEATLAHWGGNKNRAAKTLGCSLKTLYNKLAIYERADMQAGGCNAAARACASTTTRAECLNHGKNTDS